jgi:hypothetical protein
MLQLLVTANVVHSSLIIFIQKMEVIPGTTRFSEWQWVWNGAHSALVRINEELLEIKVAAPV